MRLWVFRRGVVTESAGIREFLLIYTLFAEGENDDALHLLAWSANVVANIPLKGEPPNLGQLVKAKPSAIRHRLRHLMDNPEHFRDAIS